MKKQICALAAVALGAVLAIGVAVTFLAPPAQSQVTFQVTPTTASIFTNVPVLVEAGFTTNLVANNIVLDWRQGKSLAIAPHFGRTNAGTDEVRCNFSSTLDGTNWTTVFNSVTNLGNGTTGVRGYWLLGGRDNVKGWLQLDAVKQIRLDSIQNADSGDSVFMTNIWYSWSN